MKNNTPGNYTFILKGTKEVPHRFPFLLVDRVLDFEEGRFLRAVKNVSVNEPFFQGHFPGKP
ncbi:hypothetical protein ONQ97_27885, partial [Salmonella enterica subsp. enterica serovar Virginia]|nr:hypothetical protein [Salmonella enterica subsp. enterica serovar Virginia]